jgi:hypothetical protein
MGLFNEIANPTPATDITSKPTGGIFSQMAAEQPTPDIGFGTKVMNTLSGIGSTIGNAGKTVWNALTSSEQNLGNHLGQDLASSANVKNLNDAVSTFQTQSTAMMDAIDKAKASGQDTSRLESIFKTYNQHSPKSSDFVSSEMQAQLEKGFWQTASEVGGVGLDIASAGTYGNAAKGAESGVLLTKAANKVALAPGEAIAKNIIESSVKPGLSTTLKSIGKQTAVRAAVGGGTGYAYDVTNNLQQGKTGLEAIKPGIGTALGIAVPTVIGGVRAGVALTKETAPSFINSLIKPNKGAYAYDKNPGKTVSEMGITGNSISDFENNLNTAKNDVGQQLGAIYSSPANNKILVDVSPEVNKIDTAISDAAKGGKNNQAIVNQLQNIKDALLYEHGVDAEGNIIKVGDTPRNLTNLSAQETQDLIQEVASHTKFTGNPSDDKTVNSVLQNIYGGIRSKLNETVGVNNPEVLKLNEQYGGLTSALQATRNREVLLNNSNKISMPVKVGGTTALITALSTGGAAIPAILAGLGAAGVDKAMGSTYVKTRIASWLGSATPSMISKIPPEVKTALYRALPKFASQLGQNEQ